MTIIVALRCGTGSGTWLGSDTQCTDENRIMHCTSKWTIRRNVAVAVAGPTRAANLLDLHSDALLGSFIGPDDFLQSFRTLLKNDGWNPRTTDRYLPDWGIDLAIATPDKIWDVGCSLDYDALDPVVARGSGMQYALGAYHALRYTANLPDAGIVRHMIEAACTYDTRCSGHPWLYLLQNS